MKFRSIGLVNLLDGNENFVEPHPARGKWWVVLEKIGLASGVVTVQFQNGSQFLFLLLNKFFRGDVAFPRDAGQLLRLDLLDGHFLVVWGRQCFPCILGWHDKGDSVASLLSLLDNDGGGHGDLLRATSVGGDIVSENESCNIMEPKVHSSFHIHRVIGGLSCQVRGVLSEFDNLLPFLSLNFGNHFVAQFFHTGICVEAGSNPESIESGKAQYDSVIPIPSHFNDYTCSVSIPVIKERIRKYFSNRILGKTAKFGF